MTIYVHAVAGFSRWGDLAKTLTRLQDPTPFPSRIPHAPTQPKRVLPNETQGEAIAREMIQELLATYTLEQVDAIRHSCGLFVGHTTSGLVDATTLAKDTDDAIYIRTIDLGRMGSVLHRHFRLHGPVITHSTACTSSGKALIRAVRQLKSSDLTYAIAGGFDLINDFTLAGFSSLGALSAQRAQPFCKNRTGLHLGNGGAFFLLSKDRMLFGKKALAILSGYGESNDAHHISAPHPDGLGARLSMQQALQKANCQAKDIDFLLCHGTATEQNDIMESKAYRSVFTAEKVPCISIKEATGHTLAGASALNLGIAYRMLKSRQITLPIGLRFPQEKDPRCTLSISLQPKQTTSMRRILTNAFAFGGSCVSILIEKNPT